MQGRRVQAAAAPVSFSEQFKNEKPSLLASSQVSSVPSEAAKPSLAEAKSNPFAKK
eukprot:CAMPEP_0185624200 /NCGR_PEP_ID=MMETSP0436-20130131/60442_1 /TAXON_ID=626734 ORGANISM="Favella taraikaensis, Strain Fe Narragansett Bay" /NCGR_SAMPLE_ID=MMETSP0436 /ASSEMBLY_ACC=CAM_ASM_000390 /LENGTH=55 /DNA_ID=CAMNT_0028266609 /DNA_START=591 /DNA_END=755 /DNA_ORIENTATION=-